MPTKSPKRVAGRFAPEHSPQDLLATVRRVASHGQPDDPAAISQAAYDRARKTVSGAPGPRAYRIVERLNTPWPQILSLAFGDTRPERTLGVRRKLQVRDELDRETIVHYLQRVAAHLGTEQLSVGDYDRGRQELIAADQRRTTHRSAEERLIPSGQMIVGKAGSWRQALSWADLQPATERKIPEYPAGRVLDDFIVDFGYLPSWRALDRYRQARGVAVTGFPSCGEFIAWRDKEMSSGRARRHGAVPLRGHGGAIELDPAKISPPPAGYAQRRGQDRTLERVKEDIGRALDLVAGESLTQRAYQHLATSHGLLALSTIQRIGRRNGGLTWAQIRDQVVAERAGAGVS